MAKRIKLKLTANEAERLVVVLGAAEALFTPYGKIRVQLLTEWLIKEIILQDMKS
jgi:hypothetical protein